MFEFKMKFILIFAFATGFHLSVADPCTDYTELPFADLRFVHNVYKVGDHPINDRYLKSAWYRAGNEDMPTFPPKLLSCGTKMPIWLNGTIPPVSAKEVSRSACVMTGMNCTKKYTVKVQNCGLYRVYFLSQTKGSEQAYCFGVGEAGEKPSYTPPKATFVIGLTHEEGIQRYTGYCQFDKRIEKPELFYQVTWYVDDVFLTSMRPVHYTNVSHIILDESNLVTLGKNISCSVRARATQKGPPGLSVKSDEVFIGIKVLNTPITIKRGDTGVLRIQPTVPIGCYPETDNCRLPIQLIQTDYDGCRGVTTLDKDNSDCGSTIFTKQSTAVLEIAFAIEEDDGYASMKTSFNVVLRTDEFSWHTLWSYYSLPLIKVTVQDVAPPVHACSALNDPHMLTFDQRPYDIQYEGDFIMYRHTSYPIQVQARFRSCHHGFPFCVWGVAVQAGRDVFVIDKKSGYADFRVCEDAATEVWSKGTTLYRIYTPIGTRIEVSTTGEHLTVKIYPSVRDQTKTEGLCGTLNNDCTDDFKKSDNSYFRSKDTIKNCGDFRTGYDQAFKPKTFSDSWLVENAQVKNLFELSLNVSSMTPWYRELRRCICNHSEGEGQTTKITCFASMVSTCPRKARGETKKDLCKVHSMTTDNARSKRSIIHNRSKRDAYHQHKRKSKPSHPVHMTEPEARSHCESVLGNSKIFQLCGKVPNVNTHHSIEICIMDIMLSNSTDWIDSSREALQENCLANLELNTTLETKGVPGHPSIAASIKEIACPGNCSDTGICVNGSCKCDDGFGGPDCSIDLSIPPLFEELLDGGMCDKQGWACDAAMAKGDDFLAEGHLKCNMTPFWYDNEGEMHGEMGTIVTADIQTFMNLFCPLTLTRRRRDTSGHHTDNTTFIEGYHVSLSNDGIHFSDVHTLFVFDSKCQTPVSDGTKQAFVLKEGYCFINNQCVDENDINPADVCQTCNPAVSAYKWSKRTAMAVCNPVVHEEESNYLWIIGLVAGVTAAGVVIGLIIWKIKIRKVKRVSDSTLFTDTVRGRPSTAYSPPT